MGLRAGDLDRRITIQRASVAQDDGTGEEVSTWLTHATVWASKRDVSDAERAQAGELSTATISTRFQIRWSTQVSDVSPKDRVLFEGRVYDIVGVKELGRREGLELSTNARVDT